MKTPDTRARIEALHAWYGRNVLPLRLTPEVERLWLDWLAAGFNGGDLRDVIRYVRRQISLGRRNEGALKLSNLLARSEGGGFLRFEEDLGLARARANLSVDRRLEPPPDQPAPDQAGRASGEPVRQAPASPSASARLRGDPLPPAETAERLRRWKEENL
jgi:hypothetical protein